MLARQKRKIDLNQGVLILLPLLLMDLAEPFFGVTFENYDIVNVEQVKSQTRA